MGSAYALIEHGTIHRSRDFPGLPDTLSCLYLPDPAFDSLRAFVTTCVALGPALTYGYQRGHELIRCRNYVGLLETPDGIRLEILPKISFATPDAAQPDAARAVLVRMLRHLRHSPFRRLGEARLRASQLPLWEVFLAAFLDEAQTLIGQGIQSAFVTQDVERSYLRGKWRVADQLRQPFPRADRFALRLSHCQPDTPPNRLLKTTLEFVVQKTQCADNQQFARRLLTAMPGISSSESPALDLAGTRRAGRLYARYGPVLDWAALLLAGQVPGASVGGRAGLSLLFPMERVFEDYVSAGFRQVVGVSVQESSAHLVEAHTDGPRFGLRPDVLLRQDGRTRVFDMKWKTVSPDDPTGNYGLEQADLYQLYAYGQKYEADEVVLVFPAHDTFREPLPAFRYDARTRLYVVPFDLTRPLADEVEKLVTRPLPR